MRWSPPAHRGLDIVAPVTVYRVIGRRPSAVYVGARLEPTHDTTAGNRLWDLVFLQGEAEPGDQLQDRPGGLVLVTKGGECYPVQLSSPEPRQLETAFTHADHVLAADRTLADRMISEGVLAAGTTRRPKRPPAQPSHMTFAEDHPLVVTTPPEGLVLDAPAPMMGSGFRSARRPAAE